MGKRINLAALAVEDVLDGPIPIVLPSPQAMMVPVHRVAANPLNPRLHSGDLTDLSSMRSIGQLQSCAVVRRAAFVAIFPEHAETVAGADFVVVAGSRRRAAVAQFGLPTLSVTALDHLADSRAQFFAASVAENIDRKNLDVLDEARAVQRLIQEAGSGKAAGDVLGKTKGWVSQRLSLLKLSEPMMALLQSGELPVRVARRLAALPSAEQLPALRAEQELDEQRRFTAVNRRAEATEGPGVHSTPGRPPQPSPARTSGSADRFWLAPSESAAVLASQIRQHLDPEKARQIGRQLVAHRLP